MATYSISTLHTGTLKEGALSAEEFARHVSAQWQTVEVYPTTDPKNPYILEWKAQIGSDVVTGRLGRRYYRVEFTTSVEAAARFAVWYRTLVPSSYRLGLARVEPATAEYHALELSESTTEQTIMDALPVRPKPRKKREAMRTWQVIPGGHLGKLSEHYAAIQSLFFTPNDELWTAVGPGPSVYVQGQWQQTSESQIAIYGQGRWRRMETHYMPVVWYRDRLWGIAEQGFGVYDQGSWRLISETPFSYILCLTVDQTNRLWVGTLTQGLWRTENGHTWEQIALPSHGHYNIGALWTDAENTIWIAELGQRPASRPIYRWRHERLDSLPLPSKPGAFHHIVHLTTDTAGHLWAGTNSNGVWRWSDETWTHFAGTRGDDKPGLPGSSISGLYIDRQQRVWAMTHNGIGCFTDGIWWLVLAAPELPSHEHVLQVWNIPAASPCCCHLAKDGRLWVGTTDGQVGWIDTTKNFYDNPQQYIIVDYEPIPITPQV
jgi:hypothetical protein